MIVVTAGLERFSWLIPSSTRTMMRQNVMPIAGLVASKVGNWTLDFARYKTKVVNVKALEFTD